jgi:hypothetical protein
MMTIMIGMQGSFLVLESSNRHKVHECLKGTNPQSIVFDPRNPNGAYCGTCIGKGDYEVKINATELNPRFNPGYSL